MTVQEYQEKLHDLYMICSMNSNYHQSYSSWWKGWDRAIRIVVGFLAVLGLVFSVPGFECHPWLGFVVGIVALIAAVALNVVPVNEWGSLHDGLFQLWIDLKKDVAKEQFRACDLGEEDGTPHKAIVEKLMELDQRSHDLDSKEPAANRKFLKRCQEDFNESIWGEGIRTNQQVEAARTQRLAAISSASVAEQG